METIKTFFIESWRGKLASLLIAFSIWYLIKSHLEADQPRFPVPGTEPRPARTSNGPTLDETILSPLAPPVPGGESGN
ncbi:MAG: hypothetical protein AAGC68_00790 [Verrucomicrobiota bacterium]